MGQAVSGAAAEEATGQTGPATNLRHPRTDKKPGTRRRHCRRVFDSLAAVACRVSRNAMQGVANSAYYAFGRTKGLGEGRVFSRHGLRNVAVPVLAHQAMQLVYLIEGVVVVETLFAWPGIGHALVHAIVARDVPMIQGTALVLGLMFVLLNALVDLLCHRIDPRRREA